MLLFIYQSFQYSRFHYGNTGGGCMETYFCVRTDLMSTLWYSRLTWYMVWTSRQTYSVPDVRTVLGSSYLIITFSVCSLWKPVWLSCLFNVSFNILVLTFSIRDVDLKSHTFVFLGVKWLEMNILVQTNSLMFGANLNPSPSRNNTENKLNIRGGVSEVMFSEIMWLNIITK